MGNVTGQTSSMKYADKKYPQKARWNARMG